jgi:hypothetical protein
MSSIPFTSSPLSDAGMSTNPTSTLDSPNAPSSSWLAGAGDIISSVGNVILGGLAISRLPSNQPNVSTSVQSRASGTVVTTTPTGLLSGVAGTSSISSLLIIALVIVGGIALWKHFD